MPADNVDRLSAPVWSGTFHPAVQLQWWLLLERPKPWLCVPPCGQSDLGQGPSVLALGEDSDQVEEGNGHHVVALAWAWVLLQEHVEGGSLAVWLHKEEGHSLEAEAGLVVEGRFLRKLFQVAHSFLE